MSDQPPPGWGQPPGQPPQGPPPGWGQPQPPQGQPPQGQPPQGWAGPPQGGPPQGYGGYGQAPGYGAPPPQPQKSRTGLVLGLALGLIALLVVGGVAVALLGGDDDPVAQTTTSATPTSATPTPGTGAPGQAEDDPGAAAADPEPTAGGDATAAPGGSTDQSVFELAVGTCFDDPGSSDEIQSVGSVPCDTPHDNEVFALVDHPAGADAPYPGREALQEFGEEECRGQRFTDYVGTEYANSRYFASQLTPTEGSWAQGDREVVCVLFDTVEQLQGSVQGSGA